MAYEAQLAKTKQELGAAQSNASQLEKRVATLQRDYATVEDELEETKKTVIELMGRKDCSKELEDVKEEKEALALELERVKKARVKLRRVLHG